MPIIQPIQRIAIVNRGEAAMRCIRGVKALRARENSRLQVVALYTDADREAPFVRHADMAHRLPVRSTAVGAYLDHALVLGALTQIGADAVWPGWGFVAESPEFVDKLTAAGLRFLGPTAQTMRRLGDKIASKHLAERLNVPVTAWSSGATPDLASAVAAAERIGVPLVVKASAGGGGRGIRVVERMSDLAVAFESASSEARHAFGDDRLFLEAMVQGGRHIEVQIVADMHGFVRAVGTRDCSVQRRHQKVIEEAPPSGIQPELLEDIKRCAERLAAEVNYSGVGTVEFLVRGSEFFFLEMNPRLQVEHGITEEVTRLDLVELQIRIARGESLEGLAWREQGACIEARLCAEDPDANFLPAPGRVALFSPALGPRVRIDTGVSTGSVVPAAFDSLVAKVMATGENREEARARLVAALLDTDIVIEGGATNKPYLLELLESDGYRRGGVDTRWLDRWNSERTRQSAHGAEALVLAAILAYRVAYRSDRRAFFADTSSVSLDKAPSLGGREISLEYQGQQYRLRVYSVGAMRYRVHMDGHSVSARFGDSDLNTARVVICGRYLRAVHDVTDAHIRLEIEGSVHKFGRQTAGQMRAGASSVVISLSVQPGDSVEVGQSLGFLEAMKMEIAFVAPVAGLVTEVRVRKGQQVSAGEIMLVIDPARASSRDAAAGRLLLPTEADPLAPLFTRDDDGWLGVPDLLAVASLATSERRQAMEALNEEVWRTILGFDVFAERFAKLLEFMAAPLPAASSPELLAELGSVRAQLIAFVDIEQLFQRARPISEAGSLGPSNSARFRTYLRRIRQGGVGIADEFLSQLRSALRHYGLANLEHGDELERAVLRMWAAQRAPAGRRDLVVAVMRRLLDLADLGLDLSFDLELREALVRITTLRNELPDILVNTAQEVHYRIFQVGELNRSTEQATTLSAFLRRLYAPKPLQEQFPQLVEPQFLQMLCGDDGRVLGFACQQADALESAARLSTKAAADGAFALELLVWMSDIEEAGALLDALDAQVPKLLIAGRFTVSLLSPGGQEPRHETWARTASKVMRLPLHGLHPEAAQRVDLQRYANFDLERLRSAPDHYCFHAFARSDRRDERMFVLVDLRDRPASGSHEGKDFEPIFERAFLEAARTLRLNLSLRDPRRNLRWNRIAIHVAHPIHVRSETIQLLERKLLPAGRYLGIEKTLVRLHSLDSEQPGSVAHAVEGVFSELAGSRLETCWREPRREPLVPASDYERRVATARRRGLVYPYEVIRMLTGVNEDGARERRATQGSHTDSELPIGSFEEFDLDPTGSSRHAVSVMGRAAGANTCSVVFGILSTPTAKVPEGMRRVVILSDPTRDMGALASAECDRIVAAIDLAARLRLPVEWLPISSGARIAMDSGTENLDSTARVVRRIVTFTQAGGTIHLIVTGVNVGAQSYWDALATMLMHTKGVLIMTLGASMVLTGAAALAVSGGVSAEDEVAIGGHEQVMGPNGQAQYFAPNLLEAYRILFKHYDYTYVVPGESGPRSSQSADPLDRSITLAPYGDESDRQAERSFATVGELFDQGANPGRKRPFAMRSLMGAVIDRDGGHLERWASHAGAETAIVWDAHLGGAPVCLLGIESQNVARLGYRPADGPAEWNGGTLFPQSSKKVARALNAASGNRPVVVLANLSGFDGSPESMRKLQLEYGAEIARAVVNFKGALVFCVVARYHGGAYVVFSRELNDGMRVMALEGSYASVIGGGPAAAVVFPREVQARVSADPRLIAMREALASAPNAELRSAFERMRADLTLEKRAEVATEFDGVHTVERALRVGSLHEIIPPARLRAHLVQILRFAAGHGVTEQSRHEAERTHA